MIRGRIGKRLRGATCALLLLAAAACRPPAGKAGGKGNANETPVPSAKAGALLPGPIGELLVAEALYGGGGGREGMSRWRPKRLWQVGGPAYDARTPFTFDDVALLAFAQGGSVRAFVVSTAVPAGHDCPRCAPIVGAVALTEVKEGWRVDAAEPELGTWGSKGGLPGSSRTVRVEKDRRLLMILPVVEADGTKETSLVLVAEKEGTLVEVLRVEGVRFTNEGTCGDSWKAPCHEWDFAWTMVHLEGQPAWDFELTRSGTRPDRATGKVEPFSDERTWKWSGTAYVLAGEGRDVQG